MNSKNYKEAMDDINTPKELKRKTLGRINNKKHYGFTILKLVSIMCVFVFALAVVNNDKNKVIDIPKENIKVAVDEIKLPKVESYENLVEILEKIEDKQNYYDTKGAIITDSGIAELATENTRQEAVTNRVNGEDDYSNTNIQVQGVDEADTIKTDGKNIYYVSKEYNNYGIIVIDTNTNEMVNKIKYEDREFYPYELFLHNDKLIVIGQTYRNNKTTTDNSTEEADSATLRDVIYIGNEMTIAIIYDISNVQNINEIRKIEIEGSYVSSRMIDSNLYMISSKNLYRYYQNKREEDLRPIYLDTNASENIMCKEYNDIYYFPESEENNYLNIATLSLDDNEDVNIKTFLGAGNNVYCSENNLYITRTNYKRNSALEEYDIYRYIAETCIYKLSLDGTKIVLEAETKIEGATKNQFSLDEYNGNLRIALTAENESGETINNLYILNNKLEIIGKIENMAVGEKIYSVRFIGNKGYIVTFEQIDPLFVIDLSDPTKPKVAGELKIPGYSSYLHPYDENHIIGLGYNTKDNGYGGVTNDGLKMSMFDVSNPENPIEMFNVSIGNSRTNSEATYNHKAIMFSKEKNIIAFPIITYNNYPISEAIVYNIDLENGFTEAGTINNNDENDRAYHEYNINRIIYVRNNYYTFSNTNYKVTDMNTFEKIKTIKLTEE